MSGHKEAPRASELTSIGFLITKELGKPLKEVKQMTAETAEAIEQMDDCTNAGATSHRMTQWHDIDWYRAQQNVKRLQARIVKATQEGKWGKVKALQRSTSPFVQRQSACRQTSDRKPGQEHPRSRPDDLGYSTEEDEWRVLTQTTGLPSPTPETNLHPQANWQDAPVKHPLHAMQVNVSSLLACFKSGRGGRRRSKLVWVSPRTFSSRRHWAVLHCSL